MRIDVEVDDDLMRRAKALTGVENKSKLVETALSALVQAREREQGAAAHGHMSWGEDSDESGGDRQK
jgi:Arc/MetJ family transcription regulator